MLPLEISLALKNVLLPFDTMEVSIIGEMFPFSSDWNI